ncbi:MAG: SAM-dependent methyltransferase [Bdellovibrionales bacterium]
MALYVVATPIGNQEDLSPRAKQILGACHVVIGEEFREASTLLKRHDIVGKTLEQLNEHSTPADLKLLVELCRNQDVALISDCGTPSFCDPGADLVAACRAQNIRVVSVPGVSSLMAFLSLCGQRLDEFYFRGFLPANREARASAIKELKGEMRPIILMDTPYRLGRLLEELAEKMPERLATIGMDLTSEKEAVKVAPLAQLAKIFAETKAEFLLLLHGQNQSRSLPRKKSK